MHVPTGLRRWLRPTVAIVALSVVLFACSPEVPGTGVDDPAADDPAADDPDAGEPDDTGEPADPGPDTGDGQADEDLSGDGADSSTDEDPRSVPPITGDRDTERKSAEGETGGTDADGQLRPQAVTDVRLATHDGFDRVVFELASDGGTPGWSIEYGDPRAQGSGELVEVAGDAVLTVVIRPVLLPPDLPDDVETWTGPPIEGPMGGVVQEVVGGPIFEGHHQFFIGLDEERPFAVARLSDPARVVIDIFHAHG